MMEEDLEKAIKSYIQEKKDGQADQFVKNLNAYKRFSRPF